MSLAAVEPTLATETRDANFKRDISQVEQEQTLEEGQSDANTPNKEDQGITPSAKRAKLDTSKWTPPSITSISNFQDFKTSTYISQIPTEISQVPTKPVVIGIDEAGRGPVLGPMVYGLAYSLKEFSSKLQKTYGFADSKQLTDDKRQQLFQMIEDAESHELNKHIGWATTTMTAKDISSGMLRSVHGIGAYNLNEQAHDATINLIKSIIAQGVNVTEIYVDTVGPPVSYQAKLKTHFPTIDITVAKKADSIYPIVSTASVVAKVTRDLNIRHYNTHLPILLNHKLGSGYPSDPNTSYWLNHNVDPIFGWCFGFIRFSWQTAKDALVRHGAAEVIYQDDCVKEKGYKDVSEMFVDANKSSVGRITKSVFSSDDVNLL
ncbi:hypothetical protein CANMA_000141 [Candida margitis]|uniref:uncharacterized protein n=1 Tax=Candida margitis TaxID=1775924 RepID=UPI002225C154|nr:uncharacterized protein CANMA_000141 [Candida margitis]KAI5970722.1 hypothetical protein CANMA_000141 [Candida margitis]